MEKKTILNCYTKKLTFWYKDEFHEVDLSEGDLHDSWNGVNLKDGTCFDFNFTWDEENEDEELEYMFDNSPSFSLYATYYDIHGELLTNHGDYDSFGVDEIIGTNADYFNTDITQDPNAGVIIEKVKEFKM